jgi:Domain of unknown function (DUF4118)
VGRRESFGLAGWAAALVGPIAVSGLLLAIRGQVFPPNAALVLVLPVVAAAIVGGRVGGAASAVVASLCFDFFFTHPYYSLSINSRDDIETTVVLLAVGLIVGELVVRTKRSQWLARRSRREIDQIRRVAELAAGAGPSGRLISIVEREIVELLGARNARFERPPFRNALPRLGHGSVTIPGPETDGLPAGPRDEVEIPVWGQRREIGRIVVVLSQRSSAVALSPDDRALAAALADQLGAVLGVAEAS